MKYLFKLYGQNITVEANNRQEAKMILKKEYSLDEYDFNKAQKSVKLIECETKQDIK